MATFRTSIILILLVNIFFLFSCGPSQEKKNNKNKREAFPSGVSTACFCADYFNGGNMYSHTPSQNSKCNKMYICLDNAMTDCMTGNSSVWNRCIPIY